MLKRTKYILILNRKTLRKKDGKANDGRRANPDGKIFAGGKRNVTRDSNEDLYDAC